MTPPGLSSILFLSVGAGLILFPFRALALSGRERHMFRFSRYLVMAAVLSTPAKSYPQAEKDSPFKTEVLAEWNSVLERTNLTKSKGRDAWVLSQLKQQGKDASEGLRRADPCPWMRVHIMPVDRWIEEPGFALSRTPRATAYEDAC